MQCDIPQFSDLAQESTPLQLVDFLNDLSDFFDSILLQYDAYKIESFKETSLVSQVRISKFLTKNLDFFQKINKILSELLVVVGSVKVRV
jgi:Adenylate and Guanylate cyclase catalytic domain